MPPSNATTRLTFMREQLVERPWTFGRDLPEEDRDCCICGETIYDDNLVARNCPFAPERHYFHLLCQFRWLSTPNHTCRLCRTPLYMQDPQAVSVPRRQVVDMRNRIDAEWENLIATAGERFPPVHRGVGYVRPGAVIDLVNRGGMDVARVIGLLTSRADVDGIRANVFVSEQTWNNTIPNSHDRA